MTHTLVTLSSRAVYGPCKGQSPENPWVNACVGPQISDPRLVFKVNLQTPFASIVGFLRCFEICTGPACAVLTGFTCGCSRTRITSARAHMTSACAPYGTPRGTHGFLAHKDPVGSLYACDNAHRRSSGNRPVRLLSCDQCIMSQACRTWRAYAGL